MRALLVVFAVAVLAVPAFAQAEIREEPVVSDAEKEFTAARIIEKEGNYDKALKRYEAVIRKWPDDRQWTARSFEHAVVCLINLGRLDVAERTVRQGKDLLPGLHEGFTEKALKAIEQARALQRDKIRRTQSETEHRHHRKVEIDRLVALWTEEGVPAEEIEARVKKFRQDSEALRARTLEAEEAARRLRESGMRRGELELRLREIEKRAREIMEKEWRVEHDRGMDGARKEFLRLAERLGIPPEKAERFLEENRPRRGPEDDLRKDVARRAIEEAHEALKHHGHAIKEAHERLIEGREAIEHLEQRLSKLERHIEHLTDRLEDGRADMERLVEKLERMLTDRLGPHLKKLEDRIQTLETEAAEEK